MQNNSTKHLVRLFLFLILLINTAFAYKDQGILQNVSRNSISLKTNSNDNLIVIILPQTQIEIYACGIFGSNKKLAGIKDLRLGSLVKINANKNENIIVADKVLVECDDKRRAY
ncbi:hypothetical protein [Campylobacter insulaenigrae]|uniref:DUF5666 domain-containing protein n=2 Tax=Campylobacter insulaenigrae TaxID=260714 RepID=A0A0A8H3Z8_9BACT|nr:hypothetical protein [Campylobacter insulaenigrae]AJC88385.1 hypothetical protein CINS_1442 [Campylobacter insulaenigrae NCTC 12927]MCR6572812.1 hypothetical protein [Campylobacter insulaenigrae]MCR6581867.1 hypothetical protein [Campylobacter insulaenigrae]MCR6585113.1 hypothetical protein [Campylobacter insulaenigrae]MCR6594288.1 hypothetical protein [Campylobacter insulaenigrae]